ncbi:uncharacterized protein [Hyperolius riggenbachi]|uniref:uncharacterized protein isoform X3 n=1 Tax=Hyperolius riggenbachi TaxID=752182 RepID=UPI0035A272B3
MEESVTLLSGGLSTELEAAGLLIEGDPLWSARLLHTNPQAIKNVHTSYLKSGSEVLSTATYQASIKGFMQHLGANVDEAAKLFHVAVNLAKEAAEEFNMQSKEKRNIIVAGSIGPYGAFLHDASEYTGSYTRDMSIESASSTSFGDKFEEAVKVATATHQLVAIGVNCCSPDLISSILSSANKSCSLDTDWIVYPNSGEEWNHSVGWQGSKPVKLLSDYALEWVQLGARWLGGCCRTSPADIASLRDVLRADGPEKH